MTWLAYNVETRRIVIVPQAAHEDEVREIVAPESDGDEWSMVQVPVDGQPIDVTDKLGINEGCGDSSSPT